MSSRLPLFARGTEGETTRISDLLRREAVGGLLLIVAGTIAVVWANTPASETYEALRGVTIGPESLHLNLTLREWASDGLLTLFFFGIGLEVKREFVAGDLRDPRRAATPIGAAVGGMLAPALIFTAITAVTDTTAMRGWAIPTATDIAIAVAVLAVVGRYMPPALRMFLLTLAVVDDLLAVIVIALFYTDDLAPLALALAVVPLMVFAIAVQKRIHTPWLLAPLAILTWALVHESGIHATIAGAVLAFTVPVHTASGESDPGLTEYLAHRVRPLSSGLALPVFAFFAAGVEVGGLDGLRASLASPIAFAVIAGLLLGKSLGIFGTTFAMARLTKARLSDDIEWIDLFGVALLGGIGFTISLLITELAFGAETSETAVAKAAVLVGSLLSAACAAAVLMLRSHVHQAHR
ncbi:Na+/H+ antiporter NhaA [Prescottella equi]|uniref:Na+/H+ antiporter NhaA n=1 Tax=Rhodococcus hoagii TaxID=43767 RepID=UPI0009BFB426|nr:Na+/H+ antiporter NhaA [Prescottella equi]